jgi:hypothetical protein
MANGVRFVRHEFSPAKCAVLAIRLDELLAGLKAWPLRLEHVAGLDAAKTHLRRLAEEGSYGASPDELATSARHLRRAFDWALILSCLTENPARHVAEELAEAIAKGDNSRQAEDVLSQFWFGALLARAGLRPAVPPASVGRRPDFVVSADGLALGVEVKRPQSLKSANKAVHTAARQLRDYGQPGFIVLDLSLALEATRFASSLVSTPDPPQAAIGRAFNRVADQIVERVRGQNASGHFARVVGMFILLRTDVWHHSSLDAPISSVYINAPVFDRACAGIITHSAERVRELVRGAVEEMTGMTPIALP